MIRVHNKEKSENNLETLENKVNPYHNKSTKDQIFKPKAAFRFS